MIDVKKVIEIVEEAGELFKNRDFDVELKTSISDKVTSMDIKVENFLKERLLKLIKGSGFLGEESESYALENEYVWVVDPIDGTANFVRDLMTSCVSVGLLKNKEAVMGVVYNPYRNEMFYAIKGEGAYLNGDKISVSNEPFESSMYFTSLAPYNKDVSKVCFDIMAEVYMLSDDMRRFGSAEIELCLLACGRGDLYFELRLNPWDYCAGGLILTEAGGHIGIPNETGLRYDGPVAIVAANSKENFDKLMEICERHLNKQ